MAMLISKTTFLEYLMCSRNIWLKLHKPEWANSFVLSPFELQLAEQGNEVEEYARRLFPNGVLVTETGDEAVRETEQFMASEAPAIFQATFVVDGFIAKNDVLAYDKNNRCWDLCEIKGTNSIKEDGGDRDHIDDLAFQAQVLQLAKIKTGRHFLIHLNKDYSRAGDLEINKLFLVEDVTEKVKARLPQVEEQMNAARMYLTKDAEPFTGCDCLYQARSSHCSTFKHSNPHVPEYSIHDLARIGSSKKKLKTMVERGTFELKDIPEDIELTEIQKNQVRVHLTQTPIIELDQIKKELGALKFPLYFLDYETFAPAIPMFTGYGPYDRIPFQFSLHILRDSSAEPDHIEYLLRDRSDPSQTVAELLKKHILPGGTVIAWNKGFEQGVNKELAVRKAQYAPSLEQINTQMYDLRDIFQKQYYVHPEFRGKTSVKKVLPPLVPGLHHADLNIKEGGQASDAWSQMISPSTGPQERARIAEDLLTYCRLDTYAMFQIWRHLAGL
jgi:hypothetical protein